MLIRYPDWELRLAAEFERARSRAFAWGIFDCALHACNCVHAISGCDPAANYRETYSTEEEALALIKPSLGAFAAGIAKAVGMIPELPSFARRGDVVLVNNDTALGALGVVDLSGRYALCAAETGLARAPMKRWTRAWRVG